MRKIWGIATVVMLLTSVSRIAAAQSRYEGGGEFNNCITEYYDQANYGWFTYQNNCSEAVHITFCARLTQYCGAMDLRPGRHDSTGDTQRETAEKGGYVAYVCRMDAYAVDSNNQNVSSARVTAFRCRKL
jgi:hypothetical protein